MKRLEDMTLEELWQLFPIILTPPNPHWSQWAADEMTYLKQTLGNSVTDIHHIASTSIKGILAKPIIDLIAETDNVDKFEHLKRKIIDAGYICMNESKSRLDFNKGYTPAVFADKVSQLHLGLTGDNYDIDFRD